jgi:hypothetical protein
MKKILTIILLFAAANSLFSQADSTKTGTKVIFFGANRTKDPKAYNGSAIKLGLADIVSGLYGLHYEHELSDIFSIQVGGGLTGHNYSEGWIYDGLDNPPTVQKNNTLLMPASSYMLSNTTDLGDNYWDFTNRTSSLGYFIEIQPKFFLTEDGFDGGYFGINFQYRRYNFSASNVNSTPIVTNSGGNSIDYNSVNYITATPMSEYQNETIFAISYGYQWTGAKTIIEESISVGLRNISAQRRDIWSVTTTDGNGNYYTAPYAQLSSYSASQFYIDFTIKIGLWWASK